MKWHTGRKKKSEIAAELAAATAAAAATSSSGANDGVVQAQAKQVQGMFVHT